MWLLCLFTFMVLQWAIHIHLVLFYMYWIQLQLIPLSSFYFSFHWLFIQWFLCPFARAVTFFTIFNHTCTMNFLPFTWAVTFVHVLINYIVEFLPFFSYGLFTNLSYHEFLALCLRRCLFNILLDCWYAGSSAYTSRRVRVLHAILFFLIRNHKSFYIEYSRYVHFRM